MIDKAIVDRAIRELRKGHSQQAYFFGKAKSADWIEPLLGYGYFTQPPSNEVQGDFIRFPGWPQSEYLARVAGQEPKLVAKILVSLPDTDNPRVHDDVIAAALNMPADVATQLVAKIRSYISKPYHTLLPHQLPKLIVKLAEGGKFDKARQIFEESLTFLPTDSPQGVTLLSGTGPKTRFDDYMVVAILNESLPPLTQANPWQTFLAICRILNQFYSLRSEARGRTEDYSWIQRPAIENHGQNWEHGIADALINAVRDLALELVRGDADRISEVLATLRRGREVSQRIAVFILSELPFSTPHVREAILTREIFEDIGLHHEQSLLIRRHFSNLTDDDKAAYLSWVNDQDVVKIQTALALTGHEAEKVARDRKLRRVHEIREYLPQEWQRQVDTWILEFGVPQHPDFYSYQGGLMTGPNSPLNEIELAAMEPAELLEYLKNWQPPQNAFMDPSPEGLGRAIRSVIAKDAAKYSEAGEQFIDAEPTYVRALLGGMQDALKEKETVVNWDSILSLCEWVMTQPIESTDYEYSRDSDPGWGWTRKQIADLIDKACSADFIPIQNRERVWGILEHLLEDPEPTPEYEAKYGGNNMDPTTLAINTVRGEAVEAVVQYSLWMFRGITAADSHKKVSFSDLPEVRGALERHLDETTDPSLAVRAQYGRWFPWIHLLDAQWTADNLDMIFPPEDFRRPFWVAAWDAYVLFNKPYNTLLQVLRGNYARAIEESNASGDDSKTQHDPTEPLANHIVSYFWSGQLSLDDPDSLISRLFSSGSSALRKNAIGAIGRSLYQSDQGRGEEVNHEVQERLLSLWRKRIDDVGVDDKGTYGEEFREFGLWFCCNVFDETMTLDLLEKTLNRSGIVEAPHLVFIKLRTLATANPDKTFACLNILLRHLEDKPWLFNNEDEIMGILKSAVMSGSANTKEQAQSLINWLVERGYFTYASLLKK